MDRKDKFKEIERRHKREIMGMLAIFGIVGMAGAIGIPIFCLKFLPWLEGVLAR